MQKRRNDVMPDDPALDAQDVEEAQPGDPAAAGESAPAGQADGAAAGQGTEPGSGDVQRQLDEQRDKYLRLAAEFDNYRKRSAKERLEAAPRAQGELVKQLLDPLDDLMRFADLDPAQVDAKTVVDGANMVEKKLLKTFASFGAEVVDPVGQPFDPNRHEAVMTEPAGTKEEDDVVSRVFQVGYLFNGQLLRPARVVVKQWNG